MSVEVEESIGCKYDQAAAFGYQQAPFANLPL